MSALNRIVSSDSEYQRLKLFGLYGCSWRRVGSSPNPAGQEAVLSRTLSDSAIKQWWRYIRNIPSVRYYSRKYQTWIFSAACKHYKVSVYHEPNFISLPVDVPKVITVHDLSFIRHPETHPVERVRFMNNNIERAVNQAERIITVSHFVRQEIERVFGVSVAQKTSVIHNGVTASFYPRSESDVQVLLNRLGAKYRQFILSVGTLEPRKNIITLIRAYVNLPASIKQRYPLLIAGQEGWSNSLLRAELDRYRAEPIRWLGFVPGNQLPLLYSAAAVFVYPSFYEGFGLPVLEAMASGTPVITSRAAALCEVQGDSGLAVPSFDVNGFSEALKSVLEDPVFSERLAKAGVTTAKQFSWERSAWKHLQCFEDFLPPA